MSKRIKFNCARCKAETSKTASNFYKQKKRIGQSLCATCAKQVGVNKTRAIAALRHPVTNESRVTVTCSCGATREVSFRQSKTASKCLSCASKSRYASHRSTYLQNAAERSGDPTFSAVVSRGMATIPPEAKSRNGAIASAALWNDPGRRAAESMRRQTIAWRDRLSQSLRGVNTLTTDEFVARAVKVHGGKYDYSLTNYTHSKSSIIIICPTHGQFIQCAADHLYHENGCPNCYSPISRPHSQINDYLESLGHFVSVNDRSHGFEIDSLVGNFGIEYHGLYWHSYSRLEDKKSRYRHHDKATVAAAKHIRLYQIFEHEWRDRRPIVESMIANALGHTIPIHARECVAVELDDSSEFFEYNHLQGYRPALFSFGLYHGNELMMAISVSRHHQFEFELIRAATIRGYRIRGGLSKLLTFCQRRTGMRSLMTYADRRFSTGNSYLQCGFKMLSITKPNYWYTKNGLVFSRQQFQKSKLSSILAAYDDSSSESVNMFNNGYRRFWDAGHCKLVKTWP
jgi:hypothetical protein